LKIILADALGTYIDRDFPDDPPLPAIWLVNSPDDPPNNFTASGLECLVYPPDGFGSPIASNAIFDEFYRIELIQRDRSKHTNEAHKLILSHFPECRKSDLVVRDRDSYEELKLTIPQSSIVR
jgi:hypothetical protein